MVDETVVENTEVVQDHVEPTQQETVVVPMTVEEKVIAWFKEEVKEVQIDLSAIHPLNYVESRLGSLIERLK
jgi:pyruvate-formate lyase-activating enzyme